MERQQTQHQNSGFFLGILVGVAVTLLITTKKGRHLLQALSEEGKGKFGDWERILKDVADAIDDDDDFSGDDYVRYSKPAHTAPPVTEPVARREVVHETPVHHADHHLHSVAPQSTPEPITHVPVPPAPMPEQERYAQPAVHGEPVHHHAEVVHHEAPLHAQPDVPVASYQAPVEPTIARPRTTSRRFFRNTPRR